MTPFAMKLVRLTVACLAAVLAACSSTPPATPVTMGPEASTAPAPALATGEQWTYRIRDAYTGLARGTQQFRVQEATPGRVVLAFSRAEGAVEEPQVYDSRLNWVRRPATNLQTFEYGPAYPAFDFPLGKTWSARLTATDPADGQRFPVLVEGSVLGWERVKVPAGEFDALKVRRYVYFDYRVPMVRSRTQIVEYEWYAPAVKQAVRREARSQYYRESRATGYVLVRGGRDSEDGQRIMQDDWLISELTSYTLR